MSAELFADALLKFLLGVIFTGLLIFLPAGTVYFVNGWVLMVILFVPMFFVGIEMFFKNPELLKRRIKLKEKQANQKPLIILCGLVFASGFIVAGLTYRFNWYILPQKAVTVAAAVFLVSYVLYGEVLRENTYISRTVEVQSDHKVIDTGLYGIVRHPMYTATILMFLSMPLVLGSVYAFIVFLGYPFIIVNRIKLEEEFLKKELSGYCDYVERVRYRLVPFVW